MTQVIVNGLYLGAQYALIALGLTLIFALMNVLNFAHGQMYVFGGFITYTVYGQLHLPFVVALACSGVTLAIIGALFERLLFRTVIRRSMRDESTMLLAAGTAFFLDAVILLLFGEKQRGVPKIINGVLNVDWLIMPYDKIARRRYCAGVDRELYGLHAVQPSRAGDAGAGPGPRRRTADGRQCRPLFHDRVCTWRDAGRCWSAGCWSPSPASTPASAARFRSRRS